MIPDDYDLIVTSLTYSFTSSVYG